MFSNLKNSFKENYLFYVADYKDYVKLRGFKTFNDYRYHRRGFIECWAQPGFHKFWQIWNPGIAYFVYKLYLRLGGNKNRIIATMLAFFINGLVHSIVFYAISGQWSFVIPSLFLLFGVLTIVSKLLENFLQQNRWPWIVNSVINIGLVIYSFDVCFKLNEFLFKYFQINI